MNIVDQVFKHARKDAIALIGDARAFTYGELERSMDKAAELLLKAGLPQRTPGRVPRIGLACPNGPAHVVLALAILRAGGCLVPIASELAVPEREALIQTVSIDAVVLAESMPWPNPPGRAIPIPELDVTLLTDLEAPVPEFDEAALAAIDPVFIRFSSGTTGKSKGVVLSHATLLDRIETANRRLQITPQDKIIWILPMAHHFAVSIMLYLLKGATTVVVGSHLAEDVLAAGRQHGGTVLYGAPFHHALLAAEPSGLPWPTLRLAVSTAAPLPLATAQAFDARFGVPLSQALGIIEVGLPFVNTSAPREKPQSIGKPLADIAFDIRDPKTGEPIPVGEAGELFVRAGGMLDAYLNPWRLRKDLTAPGGWFGTGDLAKLDSDGYLSLVGRAKTVINVAGMKCFPEEVEAVIQSCAGVKAVRVFGREHPRFGTVPVAEIIPADLSNPPAVAEIATRCRNTLARYKVPVDFRFVETLPRTASGKIKR